MDDFSSLTGQLLISLPSMQGDYFSHSVTLMISHNRDGAFGLVINKPLEAKLSDLLDDIDEQSDSAVIVMESGPVEQDRLFFLHTSDVVYEGSLKINDDLALSTSFELIESLGSANGPEKVIAGLGYAGWSGGQLENEIKRDVWLVTPYQKELIFDTPSEQKPEAAAKAIGIDLNLIAPTPGHG